MHLLNVAGAKAQPLGQTSLPQARLLERAHLQEWVVAHPGVLGEELLVVTVEYDRWQDSDGAPSRDRLDILALDSAGRLVVAELKRDEDRDVHLQAITYAALISAFDLETLADAHAAYLTKRGRVTTSTEARTALVDHVGGEWDETTLKAPRIVLVAANFPRVVTHTATWLSAMGLDLTLVQVQLWQLGTEMVASFERLYPVVATEEFTLAPARQVVAAAKVRAEEKTRRTRTVRLLVESGVLETGAPLRMTPTHGVTAEERDRITAWINESPERGRARWNNTSPACLTWEADGEVWVPTTLAKHVIEQSLGRQAAAVNGPQWFVTEAEIDLGSLAASVADMPSPRPAFDWSPLHKILDKLPRGTWTTYGDLARAVGTSAQPLGRHIVECVHCLRGYRVLQRDGRVHSNFRWTDPTRNDDPIEMLKSDDVRLVDGQADESQRLATDDLRSLLDDGPVHEDV